MDRQNFAFTFTNPSSRTIGYVVASVSNRKSKEWSAREADNLTAICEPIV
jgi:hypothetical protein